MGEMQRHKGSLCAELQIKRCKYHARLCREKIQSALRRNSSSSWCLSQFLQYEVIGSITTITSPGLESRYLNSRFSVLTVSPPHILLGKIQHFCMLTGINFFCQIVKENQNLGGRKRNQTCFSFSGPIFFPSFFMQQKLG